mgnify:CR=1 FL=1
MTWMMVIPWVSSLGLGYLILASEETIRAFEFWQWALFFIGSIVTMGLAITPTTFIAVVCGYFFGFNSIFIIVLCYQLASFIGYYLSKIVDEGFLVLLISKYPKAEPFFENIKEKQFAVTFLARISPALPFGLMNVVLALAQVRLRAFFWGGLFGMLPRTLFFVWVGSQANALIEALQSNQNLSVLIVISLAVLASFYWILKPKK